MRNDIVNGIVEVAIDEFRKRYHLPVPSDGDGTPTENPELKASVEKLDKSVRDLTKSVGALKKSLDGLGGQLKVIEEAAKKLKDAQQSTDNKSGKTKPLPTEPVQPTQPFQPT